MQESMFRHSSIEEWKKRLKLWKDNYWTYRQDCYEPAGNRQHGSLECPFPLWSYLCDPQNSLQALLKPLFKSWWEHENCGQRTSLQGQVVQNVKQLKETKNGEGLLRAVLQGPGQWEWLRWQAFSRCGTGRESTVVFKLWELQPTSREMQ